MLNRKFPLTRLRRLRSNSFIRDIVDENKITIDDLIQPIFVKDSDGIEEIDKMPNVFRYGLDVLIKEVREICELGIKSIAIFPTLPIPGRPSIKIGFFSLFFAKYVILNFIRRNN